MWAERAKKNAVRLKDEKSWDDEVKPKLQLLKCTFTDWMIKQWETIFELNKIADKLDAMEKGFAMTKTVGTSAGIVGAAAGFLLAPPIAAAVSYSADVAMNYQLEKQAKIVTNLLKEGKGKSEKLQQQFDEFVKVFKSRADSDANFTLSFKPFSIAGMAGGLLAGLILKTSAQLSMNMGKTAVRAAAAVGLVIDIISLVKNSKSLKKGATSDMATEIRKIADDLRNDCLQFLEVKEQEVI